MTDVATPSATTHATLRAAALVTGASKGIGRAVALKLGRRGVPVMINYLRDEAGALAVRDEIVGNGGSAEVFAADVGSGVAVRDMTGAIRRAGFWVRLLVNNAGITRDGLLPMMAEADWDAVLSTNLKSAFHCVKATVPAMIARRDGRIVNVASVSGLRGQAGQANYGAAKAGLMAMTRSLAREVGGYNIRVNAVAPGFIETDMLAALRGRPQVAAFIEQARVQMIPGGRIGTPDEVADVVDFLLSDQANYVNGHVLVVDGGLSA